MDERPRGGCRAVRDRRCLFEEKDEWLDLDDDCYLSREAAAAPTIHAATD
jgi:hypothetical protein